MRKALYILGILNDSDVQWLIEIGEKRQLAANDVLIREGRTPEGLFILLSGTLAVVSLFGKEITYLERGEMVGEMSFIEARPPSVAVKATSTAQVLMIPRYRLQKRLEQNEGFAARFYRAIALFLSERLRGTTASLGYGDTRDADNRLPDPDELDDNVLDGLYLAGTRFEMILKQLAEGN